MGPVLSMIMQHKVSAYFVINNETWNKGIHKDLFVLTKNYFRKKISFIYIIFIQIKYFYITFITYN